MDNDYAEYGYDDPMEPLEVTAAHEYNHVLQYAYDIAPGQVDVRVDRDLDGGEGLPGRRRLPPVHRPVGAALDDADHPLRPRARRQGLRLGGLQPLARRRLRRVDRPARLGAVDQPGLLRPGAYDKAIREGHGPGFSYELANFAASTAEWKAAGSGVHEGAAFPDVKRAGVTLPTDGSTLTGRLDHTAYALFDVAPTSAPKLQLTGTLPAGTAGAIMLVGRAGNAGLQDHRGRRADGRQATVKLDDPGRFERITAVVVNGSYDKSGWNGTDWNWTRDQQPVSLAATASRAAGPRRSGPGPGPGLGRRARRAAVRPAAAGRRRRRLDRRRLDRRQQADTLLSVKARALPRLAKAKVDRADGPGRRAGTFTATATIDAATAKRLGLGRRTIASARAASRSRRGRRRDAQDRPHRESAGAPEAIQAPGHDRRPADVQGRRGRHDGAHDPVKLKPATDPGTARRNLRRPGGWKRVPSCHHVRGMRRRPTSHGRRLLVAFVVLPATCLLAVPVASNRVRQSEERQAAEATLERAQDLADGQGVRTGRELSAALAELVARRSSLSRSDRKEADQLLARPTDPTDTGQPGGPFATSARLWRNCSTHFCIHWVDSTNDAPSLVNADSCPAPDYIDEMRRAFEQSYDVENVDLGWQDPLPDGTLGGNAKTDVYVKDIGERRDLRLRRPRIPRPGAVRAACTRSR